MRAGLLALALLAGCGSPRAHGGAACVVNDDCEPGLNCVPSQTRLDGGACSATGSKTCTRACNFDSDCLSSIPTCALDCGGLRLCFAN